MVSGINEMVDPCVDVTNEYAIFGPTFLLSSVLYTGLGGSELDILLFLLSLKILVDGTRLHMRSCVI